MKWYRFWKKSGPTQFPDKTYVELNEELYTSEESLKDKCEEWAESVEGTHFFYGFEQVETPSKEWLEREIKSLKEYVKYAEQTIDHYEKELSKL